RLLADAGAHRVRAAVSRARRGRADRGHLRARAVPGQGQPVPRSDDPARRRHVVRAGAEPAMTLALTNARLIDCVPSPAGRVVEGASVTIDGGRIAEIGASPPRGA